MLERLGKLAPGAMEACEKLLPRQPVIYNTHLRWLDNFPPEEVRDAMLASRVLSAQFGPSTSAGQSARQHHCHALCCLDCAASSCCPNLPTAALRHYRHRAVATSQHRGTARGFLPRALSNTRPQVCGGRCNVPARGRVSNKPKQLLEVTNGCFADAKREKPRLSVRQLWRNPTDGPGPDSCPPRCPASPRRRVSSWAARTWRPARDTRSVQRGAHAARKSSLPMWQISPAHPGALP